MTVVIFIVFCRTLLLLAENFSGFQEEITTLKQASGHKARKAALLAEKARIISSAISVMRETEERQATALREGEAKMRRLLAGDLKPGESVYVAPELSSQAEQLGGGSGAWG